MENAGSGGAMRGVRCAVLGVGLGLALAGGCLAQSAVQGTSALASQKALDALFAMDAVRPEGYEAQRPPEGFDPEGGEQALVVYLARQKRQGADLNAYRNLGTPLHHAIRGGLHTTARWLLRNGADPLRPVQGTDGNGVSGVDALGVLIQSGQWPLYADLQRLPAYVALSAQEKARRYWPLVAARPAESEATVDELLKRRFPLPDFSTSAPLAGVLLRQGLCNGHVALVSALLAQPDAPASFASLHEGGMPCSALGNRRRAPEPLPVATWKALEQRLQSPVLPYLVGNAQTAEQARQWLASGLRRPWDGPTSTRLYAHSALQAAPPAAVALLRALPAPQLARQTEDVPWTRQWLRQAADWPLADLRWTLASIGSPWLSAHRQDVMGDWAYPVLTRREAKDAADRLARWAALTDHLRFDGAAQAPGDDGFFFRVPPQLWARWFAQGYRKAPAQWAEWIDYTDLGPLQQAWPLLAQYQPEVAARALTWLVSTLSAGPSSDPLARTLGYRGGYLHEEEWLRKAQFLKAQGLRVPEPRWLAAKFRPREAGARSAAATLALQNGWVREPPTAVRTQLARAPLDCAVRPSDALRRSLAAGGPAASLPLGELSIQPLALPGQTDCGWLVSTQTSGGRASIMDESFGEVHTLRPCTDAQAAGWLWNGQRPGWVELPEMPVGGLWEVRRHASAERLLLSMGQSLGTCGQAPGAVHAMGFAADGTLALQRLQPGHSAYDALVLQCDVDALESCFGVDPQQPSRHPADARSVPVFADAAWPQVREAFFSAIDRLDRPALAQLREQGLFGSWLTEAVQRVDASATWTLDEKRQRMAWLQGQGRYQLRPEWTDLALLNRLATWLPAEDWGPLIASLQCSDRRHWLQALADSAEVAQQPPALARRLRAASASAASTACPTL